jgi:hypothetical protein
MVQIIRRGILASFDNTTCTASVFLMEATSAFLAGVPCATHIDGTSAQVGALCAVLFFDEQNHTDAVVLAIYPNGSSGVPTPPPGRMVFVTGYQQLNAQVINSGTTSTFTLTGGGSGIPAGALGVVFKVFYSSPTVGASLQMAPSGAAIASYVSVGNTPVANAFVNGGGLIQLDSQGRLDIKANGGNCTVTLYTHGYIF